MKVYSTSTKINATAETIWSLLIDSATYHEWNDSVDKVEGNIAVGKQIKVFAKISPERAFPVTVQELVPCKKMVWRGGMPMGLFKGIRTFSLVSDGKGGVEFNMREEFSGLLSPIIVRLMPDLTDSFEQFANSLKKKAESMSV